MSAVGMLGFMFLFPMMYILLWSTNALVYLYNPFVRIGSIIVICAFYFWYATHKKYTKRENDFLENLSLKSGRINGVNYFYTAQHYKKTTSVTTWIEGIYGYDFTLKFEGRFERFFKALGFDAECQTGEKRFDKMIYIVSDDAWLCQELKHNEAFRQSLYDIFWCYDAHNFDITKITCFDGRLMVTASLSYEEEIESLDESLADSFTKALVPLMHVTMTLLPSKQTINEKLYREKTSRIAFGFYVIIVALLVNGVAIFIADGQRSFHVGELVHSFTILPLVITITASVFVVIAFIAWFLLRKSSRFLPLLAVLLTLGLIGIFTTTWVEIKEVNFLLDDSLADAVPTSIYKKEMQTGRRGSKSYYMKLHDWHNFQEVYTMRISHALYNQITEGDRVIIFERKGFLNFPWIERMEVSSKP